MKHEHSTARLESPAFRRGEEVKSESRPWWSVFEGSLKACMQRSIDADRDLSGTVAEILDIREDFDRGYGWSDVTGGDDPRVSVVVTFRDGDGETSWWHYEGLFTDLIRKLTDV